MSRLPFILLLFSGLWSCQTSSSSSPDPSPVAEPMLTRPLFRSGEANYACFRIPAIIQTTQGRVLAFCEGRKNGCSDTGDIDLVMKSSDDQGRTWSELVVIWDDGANVCGNPAPVVDEANGNIHLLLTWNLGEDHESEIIAGTSQDTRRVFHLQSTDEGNSWSAPREITSSVKEPDWTWYATGPVHGIQLRQEPFNGRLMIPCDHIEAESKRYFSHVIFSDDGGKSWELGGTTPQDQVNECTIVELATGELVLNMRNYARQEEQARQVAISRDGGTSWQEQRIDPQLPEPRCQGAMLAASRGKKQYLLFTNPANDTARIQMTLSISADAGQTWSRKEVIYPAFSAYSDLVEVAPGKLLILHEGGQENPYEQIFASLLNW